MKIAVVGAGPAAASVLAAIEAENLNAEVTVFEYGQTIEPVVAPPPTENPNDRDYLIRLYRHLRKSHGYTFPPPKTQYGYLPERAKVDGLERVWSSAAPGGLSQIWGASVFPFTDRELKHWPINAGDLAPYYQKVADMIGISGDGDDELSRYFGSAEINRPPAAIAGPFAKLMSAVKGKKRTSTSQLLTGVARLALETREEKENNCIFCGGCMTGCSRGAIYCAATDITRFKQNSVVGHIVAAKVLSIDRKQRTLEFTDGQTVGNTTGFDRIYLAAGCLGSSEIMMRSFGLSKGPVMVDNTVVTVPIVDVGFAGAKSKHQGSQVLTNLVIGHLSDQTDDTLNQIQLYPTFEHLWRYYLPHQIWPIADWFGGFLKQRLIWARIYLSGEKSAHYGLQIDDKDNLSLNLSQAGGAKEDVAPILNDLKESLAGSGFIIPPFGHVTHGTSSHYAGTFPYGGDLVDVLPSGEVAPGIYLCDASVFNSSPSVSPTFTIMANAWRTAAQSLRS